MRYNPKDHQSVQVALNQTGSNHLETLARMLSDNATYSELFEYGLQFLPRLRDPVSGQINLDRLDHYEPEIVSYFHAIADMPSLALRLKDLATDLAIFADGEAVQNDAHYMNLDPEKEIKKALSDISGPM